jgi:phenylacetic acid degradation operon negative regulatory protein
LLVTLFGDSVTVHGGSIWLGSLVRLAQPFGLNERLVRTAVFRLTRERWLQARALGRRRFYELTDRGIRSFESADRRIYDPPSKDWDGCWRMVLASHEHLQPLERQQLRRELLWRGYAAVGAGLYVHPTDTLEAVREFCADLQLSEPVVVLKAEADTEDSARLQYKFARAAQLEQLAENYRALHARLAPFTDSIAELNDEQAFVLRTLTIHEYRRVLLRDPCLPAALLPRDWPGGEVRQLCAQLYRALLSGSERFLQQHAEDQQGTFTLMPASLHQRFRNA